MIFLILLIKTISMVSSRCPPVAYAVLLLLISLFFAPLKYHLYNVSKKRIGFVILFYPNDTFIISMILFDPFD